MSARGGAWGAEEEHLEAWAGPIFRPVFQYFTHPFGRSIAYKLMIKSDWKILGVLTGSSF